MERAGHKRRWLWGLAALPVMLLLGTLGYTAWVLYDPVTRMPPAEALPLTLSAGARDKLLDLYSRNPDKRTDAAYYAGQLASDAPEVGARLAPFLIGLLADCDSPVRPRPAFTLAYARSLWAPPDVVMRNAYFFCNPPRRPDAAAARGLASIGKPAIGPLTRVLHESKRTVARHSAVRALGCIDDPRAREALLAALKDPAWEVRFGAIEAIQDSLGTCDDGIEDFRVEAVAGILGAARDDSMDVRAIAARVLNDEYCPKVRAALLALLRDPEPTVRKAAIRTLGDQGACGAELVKALRDPDAGVRKAAEWQLTQTRKAWAVKALQDALKDNDAIVREMAAAAMKKLDESK